MSGLSAPADRSVLLEKQSDDGTSVPEGELMVARPGGEPLWYVIDDPAISAWTRA